MHKPFRRPTSHSISTMFVFVLVGLFALTSLILMLIGTRVYRHVTEDAARNSDSQLVLTYLGNKVHTFDSSDGVLLANRDGLPVLCLSEIIEGEAYETDIYVYQGTLRERFMAAEDAFDPADGEALTEVTSLTFAMLSPNLLQATVVMPDGETRSLRMALRASAAKEAN